LTDVAFRKPDPRCLLALAKALDGSPAEMVHMGNEPKDIAGANAAGVSSVLIDRDRLLPEHGQRFAGLRRSPLRDRTFAPAGRMKQATDEPAAAAPQDQT
jgi:FMN phosphatase YigB (HAD superfamily)